MPEIKHYTVTETRKVRVSANDEVSAARLAKIAFDNPDSTKGNFEAVKVELGLREVWGHTHGRVEVTDLKINKDR